MKSCRYLIVVDLESPLLHGRPMIMQMPQGLACGVLPVASCDTIVVRLANYYSIGEVCISLSRCGARW